MFGLPVDASILLFVSVGLGLGLELVFHRARRRERKLERKVEQSRGGGRLPGGSS